MRNFLFGGSAATEIVKPFAAKTPCYKLRDMALEEKARTLLMPVAPDLSEKIIVGWNPRMRTTAGVAIASRWEIWLNPELKNISDHEVMQTLLHELAHLLAQHRYGRRRIAPHGVQWREACRDLGIPNEKRTHQLPFAGRRLTRRYLLRCPVCEATHERVRPPRRAVACLACCRIHHGGRYHERFRLEIMKIA